MISDCSIPSRERLAKIWSGSYCYYEMQNERKVYKVSFMLKQFQCAFIYFKRNEKTENGDNMYLWYNHERSRWQLNSETSFKHKSNHYCTYIQSTGEQ